jgi:hypothetical protein
LRTPAVRLVPAPPLEPPFDDQRAPDVRPLPPDAGAQLTLRWHRPDQEERADGTDLHAAVPPAATVGASPAAWHAALRFLDRCQEILNGYRPASHVRPMSAPMDAQTIVEHVAAVALRTARVPRSAKRGGRAGAVARRRVHVCEPRPGAAEAMAVLSQESRTWAVAFRLERRGTAWLCTAFTDVMQRPTR